MFLLKKKCSYCREKIDKDKSFTKNVKISGYVGTFTKDFCSEEHANFYQKEIDNKPKNTGESSCCH